MVEPVSAEFRRLRQLLFGAKTEKTAMLLGYPLAGGGKESGTPPSPGVNARAKSPPGAAGAIEAEAAAEEAAEDDSGARGKGHGRNGADAYTGAEKIKVPHKSLQPGDPCPQCEEGTVYEQPKARWSSTTTRRSRSWR
jgi:hypothetical protein